MKWRTLAVAAACAAAAAAALSAGPPQEQRPTFRAGAVYVRLDVYPQSGDRPVSDLAQDEFEVFEDGVAQRIETFERVVVRPGGPAATRVDPSTVREARQMASDPRARLFVLFLDTYHVDGASGLQVRAPLLRLLNRTIGQDDLVAVMTPEMSAAAVTFTRRTGAIEELLDRYWEYGKRFRRVGLDPDEELYDACYPADSITQGGLSDIAREMIDRRREKMTLDALEDLVIHLEGLREERKAVVVVSEGWPLYRRNPTLARPIRGRAPGQPQVGVGPDGRLRSGDPSRFTPGDPTRCDQDRIRLAEEDHEQQFRRMLDLANRANATFYPVDPRGLPVFDRPVGAPGVAPSPREDQLQLRGRLESLQTLASATDGLAVLNSNDIDAGLRRVVDDLSAYYLIGYYSSNVRLDGRFRSVKVTVKRPGVSVRTRRGYLAPTREEVEARTMAAEETAPATPAAVAIGALARQRTNAFVHLSAGYEWLPLDGTPAAAAIWIVAELDSSAVRRDEQWKDGAEVVVALSGGGVEPIESRHALSPAARALRLRLPADGSASLPPGDYTVRVTSKPAAGALSTTESVRITVPTRADGAVAAASARLLRRGPFSGAGWQPAGDLRFRRQERVRVEIPVAGTFTASSTRLLDRNGSPLNIPVAPLSASASPNAAVVGGELTLAPLAAGDYLLETTIEHAGGAEKVVTAFRMVVG